MSDSIASHLVEAWLLALERHVFPVVDYVGVCLDQVVQTSALTGGKALTIFKGVTDMSLDYMTFTSFATLLVGSVLTYIIFVIVFELSRHLYVAVAWFVDYLIYDLVYLPSYLTDSFKSKLNSFFETTVVVAEDETRLTLIRVTDDKDIELYYKVCDKGGDVFGYISMDEIREITAHTYGRWKAIIPTQVSEVKTERFVESMIENSHLTLTRFASLGYVTGMFNENNQAIGNAFRFGDYLVTPVHVAQTASKWGDPNGLRRMPADGFINYREHDLAYKKIAPAVFAQMGLKKAPRVKRVAQSAFLSVYGYSPVHQRWAASKGPATDALGEFKIGYKASTTQGMSGSPVLNNGALVGMHIERSPDGKQNVFFPLAPFLYYLTAREHLFKVFRNDEIDQVLTDSVDVVEVTESISSDDHYYKREFNYLSERTKRIIAEMEDDFKAHSPMTRLDRIRMFNENSELYEELLDDFEIEEVLDMGYISGGLNRKVNATINEWQARKNLYGCSYTPPDDALPPKQTEDFRPSLLPHSGSATNKPGAKSGDEQLNSRTSTTLGETTKDKQVSLVAPKGSSASVLAPGSPDLEENLLDSLRKENLTSSDVISLVNKLKRLKTTQILQMVPSSPPTQSTSADPELPPSKKSSSPKLSVKSLLKEE